MQDIFGKILGTWFLTIPMASLISASSLYSDFLFRSQQLTSKILKQGYSRNKLIAAFKKFYGRHSVIVGKYNIPVTQIISDLFLESLYRM